MTRHFTVIHTFFHDARSNAFKQAVLGSYTLRFSVVSHPLLPGSSDPVYSASVCVSSVRRLNYKPRKDLEIYNKKKIESTFVEILNEKGKSIIVGCI